MLDRRAFDRPGFMLCVQLSSLCVLSDDAREPFEHASIDARGLSDGHVRLRFLRDALLPASSAHTEDKHRDTAQDIEWSE